MKEQKWAIWISIFVFIIALGVAALLEKNAANSNWGIFWKNILIGIVGGAVLSLLLAISGYRTRRTECLESFIHNVREVASAIEQIPENLCELTIEEIREKISVVAACDDWSLGASYAAIGFSWRNKEKQKRIFEDIYSPLHKIIDKCKHFVCELNDIQLVERTNASKRTIKSKRIDEKWMAPELHKLCFRESEKDGLKYEVRVTVPVSKALNGWFWELYTKK